MVGEDSGLKVTKLFCEFRLKEYGIEKEAKQVLLFFSFLYIAIYFLIITTNNASSKYTFKDNLRA